MPIYIVAFVLGVVLLQQQASLPEVTWVWALLTSMALAFLLCRNHKRIFAVLGKVLFVATFISVGFFWAAAFAHWRLSDVLPHEWESRDIQLVGVVAELPQINERSLRFAFDVEQVYTEGAIVPKRISLAWYGDREKDTETEPRQINLPHVNAGERWRLTVRLKRPHGSINPHGFDFEKWALERNIRATGYVRESDENARLDDTVNRPSYQIERLRQEIRERFARALPGHAYAGVLAALAVGDQRAIPADQWQIFTRTGINHLMRII
jgi:competence protein ComEC